MIEVDKREKHALTMATLRAFKWEVFGPIIPRLFLIGFTYSQPVLLNRVVLFVQSDQGDELNGDSIGYGLIGEIFLFIPVLRYFDSNYPNQRPAANMTDRFQLRNTGTRPTDSQPWPVEI
jgi:hypothetical protein